MTACFFGFVRAWVKAIIHPTPLQPITKLSEKSSLAFLLSVNGDPVASPTTHLRFFAAIAAFVEIYGLSP